MDNSNTTTQKPTGQQTTNIIPSIDPLEKTTSNKLILWLVGGVVIILLAVGGIYWYLSKQQEQTGAPQQAAVQVTPKPQETLDALDKDLNSVDNGNLESDFSSLDADLQKL